MIPQSTYRLQLTPDFTFAHVERILPYLSALGVDCLYLSPIAEAVTGSTHGYDGVDPTRIRAEFGGEEGWASLVRACRAQGMGIVIDIVPNHLGIARPEENPAMWDVLTHGRESRYASWFDIAWDRAPIVAPIGADDFDDDDIELDLSAHLARYGGHVLPLAPATPVDGTREEILDAQHWRILPWRSGNTKLNYRRFFAIPTLIGVRQEDPAVFAVTHALVQRLVSAGDVTGLRVDHPDGLADPAGYFRSLRSLAPQAWIVGEKILAPEETLPRWDVDGTVGYDAMRLLAHAMVGEGCEQEWTERYQRLTGDDRDAARHEAEGKVFVLDIFKPEGRRLAALAAQTHPTIDTADLAKAFRGLAAEFDAYRTYLPDNADVLEAAWSRLERTLPDAAAVLQPLRGRLTDPTDELCIRFQQLTGPVVAKGLEDTAEYRYARFIAFNEVGGDMGGFGMGVDAFHTAMAQRQSTLPRSMTALTTHDTKRSEDVRARLLAMVEYGHEFEAFATAFMKVAELQDRPFGYFLAQTLAGVGPIERQRMHEYALKAAREAAVSTSWHQPAKDVEDALLHAIDRAYDDGDLRGRWESLRDDLRPISFCTSLAQKLIQLTMPGVPDVYQGTETISLMLVDPDNRRQVDYDELAALLPDTAPRESAPAAKLWITRQALHLRRDHPELFTDYTPILADGERTDHCLAFDRGGATTVVTRMPRSIGRDGWKGTTIEVHGTDVLTGRTFDGQTRLSALLEFYPVALLQR